MRARLVLAPLIVLAVAAHAQAAPQPIVLKGLEQLAAGHCRAAIEGWTVGWTSGTDAMKRSQLVNACDILDQLGTIAGYDLLRVENVTPHLQRVYLVVRCQSQPVYFMVVAYAPADDWKINTVNWNTDPDKVLPADVAPRQHPEP
jgi:hypothetical protein